MDRPFQFEHDPLAEYDHLVELASMMVMGLICAPCVLFLPITGYGMLSDAVRKGWDSMAASNPATEVITEVFDTNSPLSNISQAPNDHAVLDPQPSKYVYYYCGGLDVSGGGVIECTTGVREDGDVKADGGVTEDGSVGATEADDPVDATPHSGLRFSVVTVEGEEEVDLAPEPAKSESEPLSPSSAANEHPDMSLRDAKEQAQATPEEATVVILKKGPSSPMTASPVAKEVWGHLATGAGYDRSDRQGVKEHLIAQAEDGRSGSREVEGHAIAPKEDGDSDGPNGEFVEQADLSSGVDRALPFTVVPDPMVQTDLSRGVDGAPPFTVVPDPMVQTGLSSRIDETPSITAVPDSNVQAGPLSVTSGAMMVLAGALFRMGQSWWRPR